MTNSVAPENYDDSTNDNSFAQFQLPAALTTSLLRMKYNTPTPIQTGAIPVALQGKDVLGSARTGTGKTAAFSIPVIARLMTEPDSAALIMSPTRELAAQIYAVVDMMLGGRGNPIRTALLIGGESMGRQFDQLRAKPRIIIGTPGRINDHLRRNPSMFKTTNLLVLDEADRMLDMGFAPQIDEILKTMPKQRQTLMFSATFADSILKFAHTYLNKPERISVDPVSVSAVKIKHEVVETTESGKYADLLVELEKREGTVIVFVRTKHGADRLAKKLDNEGHSAGVIHGGLRQNQRDRAILAFRNKKSRILVATDVAARGLDIPHIEHVINYDLPQCTEDYIHRVGRTGRAGAEGSALCLITPSDRGKMSEIQHMLNGTKAPRPQHMQNNNGRSGKSRNGYAGGARRSNEGRSEGRSAEGRSYAGKSGFNKPRSDKPFAARPYEGKARDGKPQEARTYAPKPYNEKPQGERSYDKPHAERAERGERPYGDKPRSEKPFGDKPRSYGDKPRGDRPYGDKPRGDKPFGDKPRSDRPYGDKPRGDKPFGARDENGSGPGKKKNAGPKPFKFKEHSRKPARADGAPQKPDHKRTRDAA